MDRFDKNFNYVDMETLRPFSAGHPDGVWIASILYSLPSLALFIGLLVTLLITLASGSPDWRLVFGTVIGFVGSLVLFSPIIILLFKRSNKALPYSIFLSALFACACIASYFAQPEQATVPVVVLLVQLFGAYYFWGLKKDGLLS